VGKRAETVAVGIGWKDTQFRSRQTHHVGISPQEDRYGTKGTLGEVEGGEEVRMFEMAIPTQRRLPRWLEIILDS
jgi:hypothetical protein